MKKRTFILLLCLFSISLLAKAQDVTWDFKTGADGWNPYGDDVTTAHDGTENLVVTYTGGGDGVYSYTTIYKAVSIEAANIDKFYMKFAAHNWVKTSVFVNIVFEISGTSYYANKTMDVASGVFTFDIRKDIEAAWSKLPASGTITQIRIEIPHSSMTGTASDWNGATLDIDRIAFSKSMEKVAHWSFDTDYTDNISSIAGAVNGNPTISATAKTGAGALALDGDGDYLRMAANSVFSSTDISYSFWMKTPVGGQTWPGAARIFSTPSSAGFELGILNGNISFLGDGGWANFVIGWQNDVWNHIALVAKGNEVSFYLNGTQSGATLTATGLNRTGDFLLGSNGAEAVIASIDELSIFNYALTLPEILAEAGIVADATAPVLSAVTTGTVKEGSSISATSDETATVYLVPEGTAKVKADILAASVANVSAVAGVAVNISTTGISAGNYIVYAIDATGNVSDASASITVEFRVPEWGFTSGAEGWHDLGAGRDVAASWDNGSLKMTYIDGAPASGPQLWFAAIQVEQAFDASTHRYLEISYTTVNWPTTLPINFLVQLMNSNNEAVYSYAALDPTKNFVSIDVAALDPGWGKTYTGTMKQIQIELPHNGAAAANPASNWFAASTVIDKIILTNTQTVDIAPVLSAVTAGTIAIGGDISATSNEAATVYLVPAGTAKVKADIIAAAVANAAAIANVATTLSTTGLTAGNYIVYAIDAADNVSDASASITVGLSDPVWDFATDLQGWHDMGAGRDVTASWDNGSLKMSYFDGTPDPAQGPQLYAPGIQVEQVFDASTHRYMEITYTSVNWPVTTPVKIFFILTNSNDETGFVLAELDPAKNFATIDLTVGGWGIPYSGMMKTLQIEFPFGGDAAATPAANWFGTSTLIDKIKLTNTPTDFVAPVLSAVTAGTITVGDDVSATSNEDATIYLVPEGTAKVKAEIIAAAVANASATANVAITKSTSGLTPGNYIVYAIDAGGNVSDASASISVAAAEPVLPKWTFDTDLENWRAYSDNVDIAITQQNGKMHIAYVDGVGGLGYAPLNTPRIVLEGLSIDAASVDTFKMAFTANWPVPEGTLMPILLYFTVDAGTSYSYFSINPASGYIAVNIRDNDPKWAAALSGTITRIDIEIPHNSATNANNGDLWFAGSYIDIDSIELVPTGIIPDAVPPVLSAVTAGSVSIGNAISATSNENATLYLVPEGTAKVKADIIAAAVANAAATTGVASTLSTAGISIGNYIVYAIDAAGNVSEASASIAVELKDPIWDFAADMQGWHDLGAGRDVTASWDNGALKMLYFDGEPTQGPQLWFVAVQVEQEFDASTHRYLEMYYTPVDWPTTAPIKFLITLKNSNDEPVYSYAELDPKKNFVSVDVAALDPGWGKKYTGMMKSLQLELPHNGDPASNPATSWFGSSTLIDKIEMTNTQTIQDVAPILSAVTTGPVTIGDNISATSNEIATVYLVPEGTAKVKADIIAAVVANASATAGVAVTLSTAGISAGNYIVYAIDPAGNVSDASATIIVEIIDAVFNSSSGQLTVYPNPASDIITVSGKGLYKAYITDITGKIVLKPNTLSNNSINVSGLKSGLYFIKNTSMDGETQVVRFVKK